MASGPGGAFANLSGQGAGEMAVKQGITKHDVREGADKSADVEKMTNLLRGSNQQRFKDFLIKQKGGTDAMFALDEDLGAATHTPQQRRQAAAFVGQQFKRFQGAEAEGAGDGYDSAQKLNKSLDGFSQMLDKRVHKALDGFAGQLENLANILARAVP